MRWGWKLMRTGKRRRAGTVMAAALLLGLAGCLPGPKYRRPSAPVATAPTYKESPVHFQNAPGWKVASPQAAALRGNWWEIYQDPDLNSLEEQLNINNQTIKASFE